MNSLISDDKVVNKSNGNKDSYWINLNLVDITNESALNLNFLPKHPLVIQNLLLMDRRRTLTLLRKLLKLLGYLKELK